MRPFECPIGTAPIPIPKHPVVRVDHKWQHPSSQLLRQLHQNFSWLSSFWKTGFWNHPKLSLNPLAFAKSKVNQTLAAFDAIIMECQDIFVKKTKDYGTAWRILRPASQPIRSSSKRSAFVIYNQIAGAKKLKKAWMLSSLAFINYALMALITTQTPSGGYWV